jgi:hypothetical protein
MDDDIYQKFQNAPVDQNQQVDYFKKWVDQLDPKRLNACRGQLDHFISSGIKIPDSVMAQLRALGLIR